PHDSSGDLLPEPMAILYRDDHAFVSRYVDDGDAVHVHAPVAGGKAPVSPVPAAARKSANDNTTPSPSPGARHRSNFSLYAGLLMDSTRLRQPLPARALRLATLFFWTALAVFLDDFLDVCLE